MKIAINGAAGRMGQRLIALGKADAHFEIVAALESASHPKLRQDAGVLAGLGNIGLPIASAIDANISVDAIIDFSVPSATDLLLEICRERKIPLVFATTGISKEQEQQILALSEIVPVLKSASMSMTVILAMKLAEIAAGVLKDKNADVEIVEKHHRFKADAPSGTALAFAKRITEQMQQTHLQHGREGDIGQRPHGEIGLHAVRIGDNPGEHAIFFGLLGETLEINVKASNRDCYALGALSAAKFIVGKKPALYSMSDVLGI